MILNTAQKITQILLYEGGSLKKIDICKILNIEIKELEENISENSLNIQNILETAGLKLIQNTTTLEIVLDEEINTLINKNKVEELKSELSESSLQTLSVIIYKPKATKAEIDFVRGVDSGRSLKTLLTRGIIEKYEEKNKKFYIPTTESLKYLNIESTENAPEFTEVSDKLKKLIEGE